MLPKKSLLALLLLVTPLLLSTTEKQFSGIVKPAEEVFKKWLSWQHIMPDHNLSERGALLDDEFVKAFKAIYEKNAYTLSPMEVLLDALTASHIGQQGYVLRAPMSEPLKENVLELYKLIDTDMPKFIGLMSELVRMSRLEAVNNQNDIERFNALIQLLFAHKDEIVQTEQVFAVSNRFVEYALGQDTFPQVEKSLLNTDHYPILRMLYAVAWQNLAGNGWKHWHENSLKALKEKADQGNQIVYIAGGSDLYQMIKAGIYNIKNIDPQLPSQPKYYADDWQFIVRGNTPDGGIGDSIIFKFPDNPIIMERTSFKLHGITFKARLATGDIIELPQSTTTWALYDIHRNKLGEYVLERRFCEQTDFVADENKTLLMSFNELYFIALPAFLNGWNIDPSRFNQDLSIVVKQLRKPVTKQNIVNMRISTLLNATDFRFIALGTCIN